MRLDFSCLLARDHAVGKVGKRPKGVELRDPGITELANVWQRIAGERREELFMGCVPRHLLHADVDLGVGCLELFDQRQGPLSFGPHCPEVDDCLGLQLFAAAAYGCDGNHDRCKRPAVVCTPLAALLG